jgi:hypothetical protein
MVILRLASMDLRRRVASALLLALIVGAAFGVSLTAIAGARRNDTAYARLLRDEHASDLLANPNFGTQSRLDPKKVARLPLVADLGQMWGLTVVPDRNGKADFAAAESYQVSNMVGDDNALQKVDAPIIRAGRLPRAGTTDEIAITPDLAKSDHLHVGSRMQFHVLPASAMQSADPAHPPKGIALRPRVVGIVENNYDIVSDEATSTPTIIWGSGLRRFGAEAYYGLFIRLRHGASDVPKVEQQISRLIPAKDRAQGDSVVFQTRAAVVATVKRTTRPQTVALALFGLVAGAAAWFVAVQAIIRHLEGAARDVPTLSAVGATRRTIFGVLFVRAAGIALVATVTALVVAVALSPLTPVGLARSVEPHRGVAVNVGLLLALEALGLALLLAALVWPMWRLAGRRETAPRRVVRTSGILHRLRGQPIIALGVRQALTSDDGRTGNRSALIGASISVLWLVAASVFGASLVHFVDTPRDWGWRWDAVLSVNTSDSGEGGPALDGTPTVRKFLEHRSDVRAASLGTLTELELRGRRTTTLALTPVHGSLPATIAAGRAPKTAREVALGSRTMRQLHTSIGSSVPGQDPKGRPMRLRVVGQAVFPGLAAYTGEDPTSLGSGALITMKGFERYGTPLDSPTYYVDFRGDGHDALAKLRKLNMAPNTPALESIAREPKRPSDVKGLIQVKGTPYLLAWVLAGLAALTLGQSLITSVRRRRRELAVLKAIGLRRPQVSAIVAWHATTVTIVGLVVGIPLGIITGRVAWALTAHQLGVPSHPVVDLLVIAGLAIAALVLANLLAAAPAWAAARVPTADTLRDE